MLTLGLLKLQLYYVQYTTFNNWKYKCNLKHVIYINVLLFFIIVFPANKLLKILKTLIHVKDDI